MWQTALSLSRVPVAMQDSTATQRARRPLNSPVLGLLCSVIMPRFTWGALGAEMGNSVMWSLEKALLKLTSRV